MGRTGSWEAGGLGRRKRKNGEMRRVKETDVEVEERKKISGTRAMLRGDCQSGS